APWSTDRTYIRNAFVYALSTAMGHWAPRTRFVEMFYNNAGDSLDTADYVGIGLLVDKLKIGPERIDIESLSPGDTSADAITGGYIVKFDPVPDPSHYNFITNHGIPKADSTAVVIESPSLDKLAPAQRDYIRGYIQQMEDALFAAYDANYTSRT